MMVHRHYAQLSFCLRLAVQCSDLSLTAEANDAICDFYSELRGASQENSLPVTVRCLETIIRLSTAAAKARLAEGISTKFRHSPSKIIHGPGRERDCRLRKKVGEKALVNARQHVYFNSNVS